MQLTRREFVKVGTMAGAGLVLGARRAYSQWPVQTAPLQLFVQPLRGLGDMAPATPVSSYPAGPGYPAVDYYEVAARQFTDQLHPNLAPTTLWGYGNDLPGQTFRHLGGAVIATQGTAVRVRFANQLPPAHFLPVDNTVPFLDPGAINYPHRIAVHLHGGHVPWVSDGGPFHWFAPGQGRNTTVYGSSVPVGGWLPDPKGRLTNDFWYPNLQSGRLMWYHDHAVGNTRLNAYAGLATAYLLRGTQEQILINLGALPALEVPLVFQDKIFDAQRPGQLWYPDTYNELFFGPPEPAPNAVPFPSLNPEFWGDTLLVNGTVSPFIEVQPRRYRFRILNACNTRFMSLRLCFAAGTGFPDNTDANTSRSGPAMQLVGNEGGFLDPNVYPQGVEFPPNTPLVLAPAERADLIIDFSQVAPGEYLILYNDAPVPFPGGTPLADFHPKNNRLAAPPAPGFAPNTRSVLQFRVVALSGPADVPPPAGWTLPPLEPQLPVPAWDMMPPAGAVVRDLTLNEAVDQYGRLSQLLGGVCLGADGGYGLEYVAPPTETPTNGAVEVWNVFNLTADAHPIHFHLANVQVLSRQRFNVNQFNGTPSWLGNPRLPDPDEVGWKETVRMFPGECTTVVMKFDLPPDPVVPVRNKVVPVTVPFSPRLKAYGIDGYEYVWHCHILEHEEHDMMRPLVVQP